MKGPDLRLGALRRFALAITVVNVLGHSVFGFESSLAQMFVALGTAYSVELLLEVVAAWDEKRAVRFRGGFINLMNFLLPAHITGLAIGMLLYANDQLLPFAFASTVAIASKSVFTAPVGKSQRHFMNPSNFGLVISYLMFRDVAATVVPYQYTIDLYGFGDWLLPTVTIFTGSFLNTRFTRRIPLVLAWVGGFIGQAVLRHLFFGASLVPTLSPITGEAFMLFTFYMVPDPGTTPSKKSRQILFGLSVALTYGVIVSLHIGFALFFALALVCIVRGVALHVLNYMALREVAAGEAVGSPAFAVARGPSVAAARPAGNIVQAALDAVATGPVRSAKLDVESGV